MDPEDLEPRLQPKPVKDLDPMSVEALTNYIVGLEGEIERAREMIASKQAARGAADTFFKE